MKLGRTGPARRPKIEVAAGERVLAWCTATIDGPDGGEVVLAGTRDALYLDGRRDAEVVGDGTRLPWEEVEAADWDVDTESFRVSEVGRWGYERLEHRFTITDPGRLLELVRERVTASVVFQRHIPIRGVRGVRVIARRAPRGDSPLHWIYEYDAGIDPDDPEVRALASAALDLARDEVGIA